MTIRIAQISDAHLGASRDPFGPNFDLAAQQIRDARPDLLLATGDLSLDGADSEADLASAWARHAAIGIEWRAVPGNHDVGDEAVLGGRQPWDAVRAARWEAAAGPRLWVHDLPGWRLIGLDTQSLLTDPTPWEPLAEAVSGAAGRAIALVQHKPLAEQHLADTAVNYWPVLPVARARVLSLFGGSRPALVLSGHLHMWRDRMADGIRQVWAPSTGFIVGEPWQEALGEKRIGWVMHHFHPDGTHDCVLRDITGGQCHDLGEMPEVYGPLAPVRTA
jgi:predicted MPP superfamily phosphohydrolase